MKPTFQSGEVPPSDQLAEQHQQQHQQQPLRMRSDGYQVQHDGTPGSLDIELTAKSDQLGIHSKLDAIRLQPGSMSQKSPNRATAFAHPASDPSDKPAPSNRCCSGFFGQLGSGLADDFKRRASHYLTDYTDGLYGHRTIHKTLSTTTFLYFSVLLPCIAFGVVDTNNTEGHIDPKKTIIGQAIGGLMFGVLSGQPLIVIMTTAPLCIYVQVIYHISQDMEVDFGAFYACVGLWMSLFLVLMSITNVSKLMSYCTRSTEDIFALFTAFAFGSDGVKEAYRSFHRYYWEPECTTHEPRIVSRSWTHNSATKLHSPTTPTGRALNLTSTLPINSQIIGNSTSPAHNGIYPEAPRCHREICILFLFLMSGTLFLANSFSAFHKTPYLSSKKREAIKDYALALSVLVFTFVGSVLFVDIRLDIFEFGEFAGFHFAHLDLLSSRTILLAAPLGFMLSVLFYIDQNICGAMVHNAPFRLKKGNYFHMDLFILAILNSVLSLIGLPWMHGKLPHSHLHSKALADYEEHVEEGHVQQTIVSIRETRLTQILCSIWIGLTLLAIPYPLSYIPLPVLSGVFLYTAVAEFKSNSMVERFCLLFTEEHAYPTTHYSRQCPRKKIHLFTFTQLLQLALVSFIGFYHNPYVNMAFPLAVATFIPIRAVLLPHLIDAKYLSLLDPFSLD